VTPGLDLTFWSLLFWLTVGHCLADYPLQSEWMVHSKNRHNQQPSSFSRRPDLIWIHVLTAHAFIHAGMVGLFTQNVWLGLCEGIAHWIIDYGKSEDWYGFHTDQLLHISCKVVWALAWVVLGSP
jgi:predicted small integral membrane protein